MRFLPQQLLSRIAGSGPDQPEVSGTGALHCDERACPKEMVSTVKSQRWRGLRTFLPILPTKAVSTVLRVPISREVQYESGSLAKRATIAAFKSVGIDIFVFRQDPRNNFTVFNRSCLSRYYEKNRFMDLYEEAMRETNSQSRDSFGKQCRYHGLYRMVQRILDTNVPGDVAECGCWRGHSAWMLAALIRESGQQRDLHIFDSFEGGLSEKCEKDRGLLAVVEPDAVRREKEAFYSTEQEVSRALSPFGFVSLYNGWIPARFDEVKKRTFSLVNLDVDLYEPIRDSLCFFFPRLSAGGVIIIDDYGTTEFPGATRAVDEFLKQHTVTFAMETLGSMIIVK